ncbi:FAD-dependent oxidoreductase [Hydrogenophaga atypica]|uniref:FAD-dependent oxidoreductase n=1 Tax=Hydrogenophaga atypica TaxID=249409 RepID=A0ABW2QG39_9BURK
MTQDTTSAPRVVRATTMPADAPEVAVAIVGAGACGLTTAIRLRQAGIDCVLLERDALPSGSTALSSGLIPAAGTRLQQSLGIDDSLAMLAEDIITKTDGEAPAHLVQAYVAAVPQALDTLESLGIAFEVQDGFLYPGHRVRRMHGVPEHTGAALMAALERTATGLGADLLTEALVREVWADDNDRVIGVGYQRPDGSLEHLACRAVVLACNGFGGNADMVRELLPPMADAAFGGHVGNDGSAIAWGRGLGAALADLHGYQGHGSWITPQGALMSWATIMEGGIQVNARGERFQDESQGYSEAAVHVLHQPGSVAWEVFDEALLPLTRSFPDFVPAEAAGALKRADDVAQLAAIIGCDEATLQATLDCVDPARPDPLGRRFKRRLQAPYYVVKVTGALFHTQGGLDIDAHCRVRRADGSVLPNLLAAGGAARGVSGNDAWGYLAGNGLLSAVGGGWVAATTLIEQLQA